MIDAGFVLLWVHVGVALNMISFLLPWLCLDVPELQELNLTEWIVIDIKVHVCSAKVRNHIGWDTTSEFLQSGLITFCGRKAGVINEKASHKISLLICALRQT